MNVKRFTAKTAREAIRVMTDLVAEYGYASAGESFSISDPKEVWIMDMIGKGPDNPKGALWVARKVPDGYVTGHANQSRIRQFPLNDKKNTPTSMPTNDDSSAIAQVRAGRASGMSFMSRITWSGIFIAR